MPTVPKKKWQKARLMMASKAKTFSLLLAMQLASFSSAVRADEVKDNRLAMNSVTAISAVADDPASIKAQIPAMMEKLAVLVQKDPKNFRAHFLLARCYEKLGMEELSKAEDLAAEAGGEEYKRFVLSCLKDQVQFNHFDAAVAYNAFAEKYYPADPTVLITRAFQLHKEGKLAEEEKILGGILSHSTQDPGIYSAIASLKVEKGDYKAASLLFDKELSLYPQYEPAILGKAKTLEMMHNYKDAIALASPLYLENIFNYDLAILMSNCFAHLAIYSKSMDSALVALAVAQSPAQMSYAKERIRFLWPRIPAKERTIQVDSITQIIDKTAFGPRLHFALGDVLEKAGSYHEAEYQFRSGLRLEPNHASAYLHLGEIYQNQFHNDRTAFVLYTKFLAVTDDPKVRAKWNRLLIMNSKKPDLSQRIKRKFFSESAGTVAAEKGASDSVGNSSTKPK